MTHLAKGSRLLPLWGLLYGIVLMLAGVSSAGGGHGTYVLIGLCSAPFGLAGIPAALFGTPVLWMIVCSLLALSKPTQLRIAFPTVLTVHYGGALFLLTHQPFGDWDYFAPIWRAAPWLILAAVSIYLFGQFAMWMVFANRMAKQPVTQVG